MTPDSEQLAEEALDVFWDYIARKFPDAKTGDQSPLSAIDLSLSAERAVAEWVRSNVPKMRRTKAVPSTNTPSFMHTPGPWFIDRQSHYSPLCIKPYPGRVVCDIEGTDAESEANARLIAAVPDLLTACQGMCGLIWRDKRECEQIDFDQYERSESACLSAIAKAISTTSNARRKSA